MSKYQASMIPLVRRLLARYLAIGLACLLSCVVVAINLASAGKLFEYIAIAVICPGVLLLVGAFVLRHTLRLNQVIEEQLWRLKDAEDIYQADLQPVAMADPTAQGWNTLLGHIQDQTLLKSLDERLQGALGSSGSKHWEEIFNALPVGIAVSDSRGILTLANSTFLSLSGQPSLDQIIGEKFLDLLAGCTLSTSPQTSELFEKLQSGPRNLTCEFHLGQEMVDGVLRIQRIAVVGNKDDAGTVLWILRDITQQKLADDMRNQFLSTATHELRTPLANIRAYAETLGSSPDLNVEKQKGFYNIIVSEATRLSRFVDDLLNVSQMEAGAITVTRHETDLERMIHEVMENVQPLAVQKNIRIEKQLPPKLPKLRTDKDKLVAGLVNLLGNAVKYTPNDGQVRLLIEVEANKIHFHVEDTGIGISEEEIPRLFEKFFRSSDQRVQDINGSGLGLAFSQEVARLHGGKITALSELNKGSRFTMTLPLDQIVH